MAITNTTITVTGDTVVTGNITNFLNDSEKNGISFSLTNAYDDSVVLTATKQVVSINLTGSITEYNSLDINNGAGYITTSGVNEYTIDLYSNPTSINITSYLSNNNISISKLTVNYLDGTSESAEYIQPMREATLAEKLEYLNETKQEIKNTLINKGISVSSEDTFRSYVKKIEDLRQQKVGDEFTGWAKGNGKYEVTIADYDGTILYHNWHNEGDTFLPPDVPAHEHLSFSYWCSDWEHTPGGISGQAHFDYNDNKWVLDTDYGWKNDGQYVVTVGHTDIFATPRYDTRDIYGGVAGRYPTLVRIKLTPQTGLTVKYTAARATYTSNNVTYQYTLYWGDGTNTGTSYSSSSWTNTEHTYSDYGEYVISFVAPNSSSGYSFNAGAFTPLGAITELNAGQGEILTITGCGNLEKLTTGSCEKVGNASNTSQYTRIRTCYFAPNNNNYIVVPNYAFFNNRNLEYIALSPYVTGLGTSAFSGTVIKCIQMSDNIKTIGSSALNGAHDLDRIRFGSGINEIGESAFAYSSIKEFDFSHAVNIPTLANTNAFNGNNTAYKIIIPYNMQNTWPKYPVWTSLSSHIEVAEKGDLNYMIVGSPTITNNIVSGFSDSNYITSDNFLNTVTTSFELGTAISLTAASDNNLGICDTSGQAIHNIRLSTSATNTIRFRMSFTGGETYGVDITGSTTIPLNTKVFVKATYDNSTGYKLYTSIDGTTWNLEGSSTTTTLPYNKANLLKWGDNAATGWSLPGSIYLEDTYINVDGQRVWDAVN